MVFLVITSSSLSFSKQHRQSGDNRSAGSVHVQRLSESQAYNQKVKPTTRKSSLQQNSSAGLL
jgi:hypothetical protein